MVNLNDGLMVTEIYNKANTLMMLIYSLQNVNPQLYSLLIKFRLIILNKINLLDPIFISL